MHLNSRTIYAFAFTGLFALATVAINAYCQDTGQRTFAQVSVEPAIDNMTGNTVYLLTPTKAPFPSKANPVATAPLYLPWYPVSSTVVANDLNCQPTNCDHANVLPFASPDYGQLPGSDKACMDFNNGNPCSPVKGHDHLVGVAQSKGDFNVAWHVIAVVFQHAAFVDGKINERITTLNQLMGLWKSGDVIFIDSPVTFNCSITSERTYEMGTETVIPYP